MKNEIYEILSEVANNNELLLVETTSERNGYPAHISWSLIGFMSPEQYHAVEEELNEILNAYKEGNESDEFLSVLTQDLKRQDGWKLWYRENNSVIQDTYDVKEEYDNRDNYTVYTYGDAADEEQFLNDEFKDILDSCETFEQVRNLLDKVENLWDVVSNLEVGQIAISGWDSGVEVEERYVMGYSYDIYHYAKALTIE